LAIHAGQKSSRQLEAACKENVLFMALACQQTPDHSTFAEFIARLEGLIVVLYSEILLVCFDEGLLGGTEFSLDGLKLPSNAAKEWSGTLKDLRAKQEKLKAKIKEKLREHRRADKEDAAARKQSGNENGSHKQNSRHTTAASVERLRQKLDRIGSFLEKAEPRQGASGEIQSNVTDNESARMRTGHGTIQGYNAQALVDQKHQIIVHAHASSDGQDYR
jgi:outer membrane murein-binding lipoprotein Lpp